MEVEQILGAKIGEEQEEEVRKATRRLVEYELGFLETRSLTEEQAVLFENAKASVGAGDYESALEYIWILSQGAQDESWTHHIVVGMEILKVETQRVVELKVSHLRKQNKDE